jgi:hypothetical protein
MFMQEIDLRNHTKLPPPFHRSGMVTRERLIVRIRKELQVPLTLIVAPVGRVETLYFVGASTHPGTGMPTAMVAGRLVSNRIMDDLGWEHS